MRTTPTPSRVGFYKDVDLDEVAQKLETDSGQVSLLRKSCVEL